jgi:hypothetical protein
MIHHLAAPGPRLLLTSEYAIACANFSSRPQNCTRTSHPFLRLVASNGSAVADVASPAAAATFIPGYGIVSVPGDKDAVLMYAHLNETTTALVELAAPGHTDTPLVVKGGYTPAMEMPPTWLGWAGDDTLLSWLRFESHSTGSASVAVTETLYSSRCPKGGGCNVSSLWSWTNVTSAYAAPPPAGQELGDLPAVDSASGLLYVQPWAAAGSDVSVFELATRTFRAPLPAHGAELMCLHHDAASARLGALVANSKDGCELGSPAHALRPPPTHPSPLPRRYSLVEIDTTTGASTTRLSVPPPPAGLAVARRGDGAVCSFSQASGRLALQLVQVDRAAEAWAAAEAVFVLAVDTRAPSAAPPQKASAPDTRILATGRLSGRGVPRRCRSSSGPPARAAAGGWSFHSCSTPRERGEARRHAPASQRALAPPAPLESPLRALLAAPSGRSSAPCSPAASPRDCVPCDCQKTREHTDAGTCAQCLRKLPVTQTLTGHCSSRTDVAPRCTVRVSRKAEVRAELGVRMQCRGYSSSGGVPPSAPQGSVSGRSTAE